VTAIKNVNWAISVSDESHMSQFQDASEGKMKEKGSIFVYDLKTTMNG
jgi:hypothetical protein